MKRVALFPGSFDPITKGHEDIINRALPLFDKIIIAVGLNSSKKSMFTSDERIKWIADIYRGNEKIEVTHYEGLTVDFCKYKKIDFILRGLRTSADFEFERSVGQVNRKLLPDIETVFLLTSPEYTMLSSSIVRDIIMNNGDPSMFINEAVKWRERIL